jgi:two-component system, LuxR family, sensor histidine kinase DctS
MDSAPATASPRPAAPPRGARRAWWALPFVLSLLFVAAVAAWLQWSDSQDIDGQRRTLISDALTLQSGITLRIDDEHRQLDALARSMGGATGAAQLGQRRGAVEGLRRVWVSLTWLDAGNRIVAQLPESVAAEALSPAPPPGAAPADRFAGLDEGGLSAHLSAPLRDAAGNEHGVLVARYKPAALLRQSVPWWLARKYDVRLVDSWGQTLASTGEGLSARDRESHRVNLEPALPDAWLELVARDRHIPWWHTLPLALMAVFLLLVGAATAMLRRQMRDVLHAESAWRTEAAWRRAMEDSLTVGLRARDSRGRLVYVNRAFCDLVGWSAEELLGSMPPMPYWPSDGVDEVMRRSARNLAGDAPREGYEAHWVRRDGKAIEVMIFEARLVDALGRHIGWMGSILDITARKRTEERERRQLEALATQARLTTLGEVASALAHQLNQPLTAIAGYNAGVLRSLERAGYTDTVVLDAVRRLGAQAAEAGRIVQRIRAYLTRRTPQRERCDLGEVARGAVALLRRDLERQALPVEVAIEDALPPVWADAVLIEQVIINLVRNAADELAAAPTPAPRVRLSARRAGERFVRVDVEDNGPGLRGHGIEQLCAPFYSTKPEGMGMGLAICRSVVEAHYGGMEADTSPLGGARISFTLPVEEPAAAP